MDAHFCGCIPILKQFYTHVYANGCKTVYVVLGILDKKDIFTIFAHINIIFRKLVWGGLVGGCINVLLSCILPMSS